MLVNLGCWVLGCLFGFALEAEAVSEDELPDDLEKKQKSAAAAEEAKKEGKRKLPEYDPSSPTSEHSGDSAPAAKKAAVGDGKSPKEKV